LNQGEPANLFLPEFRAETIIESYSADHLARTSSKVGELQTFSTQYLTTIEQTVYGRKLPMKIEVSHGHGRSPDRAFRAPREKGLEGNSLESLRYVKLLFRWTYSHYRVLSFGQRRGRVAALGCQIKVVPLELLVHPIQ